MGRSSSKAAAIGVAVLMAMMAVGEPQLEQQPQPLPPPPPAPLQPQPQGGGCSRTFFSALVQLIPCRAAVAPFSPIPPSDACCSALITLGHPCLCLLANGPPLSGIDRSLALQLPERCSANFPPCDIVN